MAALGNLLEAGSIAETRLRLAVEYVGLGLGVVSIFPAGGFRRINLSSVSTLQDLPLFDSRGAIHSQKADGDPALGGQAENFAIARLMVVIPAIKAWMKQRRELSGLGIYRRDVTALEPVADNVTQGEVLQNCPTAMLYCDHVIDLVFRERESFRNTTVLTRTGSP